MDMQKFYEGKSFDAYHYFGAHVGTNGTVFRTYAPSASAVSLIGDFSDWNEILMDRIGDGKTFEKYLDNVGEGAMYKYKIYWKDGTAVDHCDPYGFGMELRPGSASIVRNLNTYSFKDLKWMNHRTDRKGEPMNIYELHMGSWKMKEDGTWYSYTEMAGILIPYLKKCGYNFIEVMPLSEHPADISWGYQNTGFFSPTSRYGTAAELKYFVDQLHQNDIGVILDFVPVHFALDSYGLGYYDGSHLYEYPHEHVGVSEWGSKNFMHSRGEVRSFLQSSANYWLEEYHFDGLRMDAIRNLLYWQGDVKRGVCDPGVEFLRNMNLGLKNLHPTAILAAEDSSNYIKITAPVKYGGLGFDYKWDMGWMNDTLDYFRTDPEYRIRDYHKLTFSMMYYYNENYLLPLSHDEVVHGKATIAQKMNGQYEDKFPQAKAMYLYMYTHPGKKLNFMGNEFAQLREWDETREQDWSVLTYPVHDDFHRFMIDLNHIYLRCPALYAMDYDQRGFEWIDCHQEHNCIYAYERIGFGQHIACVFNFSDRTHDYNIHLEHGTKLHLLISNDRNAPADLKKTARGFMLRMPPFSGYLYEIH